MTAYILSEDKKTVIGTGMSGEWAELDDTDDRVVAYKAQSAADSIRSEISSLEALVTDRRLREAVLGIDGGWLKNLNDQIATLRGNI